MRPERILIQDEETGLFLGYNENWEAVFNFPREKAGRFRDMSPVYNYVNTHYPKKKIIVIHVHQRIPPPIEVI